MNHLFLEGLKSAREMVQNKGIQYLDNLIEELDSVQPEKAVAKPRMEYREVIRIRTGGAR